MWVRVRVRMRVSTNPFTSLRRLCFPHSSHCRGVLCPAAAASLRLSLCANRRPRTVGGPSSTFSTVRFRVTVRFRFRVRVRIRVRARG